MRSVILGKSKQATEYDVSLIIGGRYLSGTTPNIQNIKFYDSSYNELVSWMLGTENIYIYAIDYDENYIYVGGSFLGYFKVFNRSTLIEVSTGLTFSSTVRTISTDSNYIYLGGAFTGTNMNRFARISKTDWTLTSGIPQFTIASGVIRAIALLT